MPGQGVVNNPLGSIYDANPYHFVTKLILSDTYSLRIMHRTRVTVDLLSSKIERIEEPIVCSDRRVRRGIRIVADHYVSVWRRRPRDTAIDRPFQARRKYHKVYFHENLIKLNLEQGHLNKLLRGTCRLS